MIRFSDQFNTQKCSETLAQSPSRVVTHPSTLERKFNCKNQHLRVPPLFRGVVAENQGGEIFPRQRDDGNLYAND